MMRGVFTGVGCIVKTKPLLTVRGEIHSFASYFLAVATLAFFRGVFQYGLLHFGQVIGFLGTSFFASRGIQLSSHRSQVNCQTETFFIAITLKGYIENNRLSSVLLLDL